VTAVGGAVAGIAAAPAIANAGTNESATKAAAAVAATDEYAQKFLEQYNKIKDPANGYFSASGVPYHSVETLLVEAPDHGHQTTSEAFSYWMWLEATYGRVSGDWTGFNTAWTVVEKSMIPGAVDQPSNSSYNPNSPASYIPEFPTVEQYPGGINSSVASGVDPIANELKATYGTADMYAMHWIIDVDNVYGYGNTWGTGAENGPSAPGPAFMNTYQRGPQESVFETVPQPSTDLFKYGGPNGYLDLFVKDSSYAKQWKYTNAPDADARAVQAAYWAVKWAAAQGKSSAISASVAKAAKLGDYLRYAQFDKYFKKIGNCTSPTSCAAGSGRNSQHYLLGWYFAWGGAEPGGGWAWRIGDGAAHSGYQNPMAAYALSTEASLIPKSSTAKSDWASSLARQIEFLTWLQSADGGIAGGATNSWDGAYAQPPAGTPTFYGMAYDWEPVYHDPPSNNWFGMQAWGMERWCEYYYVTKDVKVKAVLDKWVSWVVANSTVGTGGDFSIPSTLSWTGQPDTWNPANPGKNTNLHVTVAESGTDVGVAGSLIKALLYYAAATGNTTAQTLGKGLLDALSAHADPKGVSVPETRKDYSRFNDPVYLPPGWTGKMPNGDVMNGSSTFLSIRTFYKKDPDWPKVEAYLNGGPAPVFTYHRFWAQADIATAYAVYSELFGGGPTSPPPVDTTAPSAPTSVKGTVTASTVALTWTASTDNVAVSGYQIFRGATQVGTSTTTSFTDTGLTASTAYTYTVKARDAAGNVSDASTAVTVTTSAGGTVDTTPPSAPTGLRSTGVTASSVTLTWTASTDNVGVTAYQIYRDGTLVGQATSPGFTESGLTASTTYSYTVKARDAAGNVSASSSAVSATTFGGSTTGNVTATYHTDSDWGAGFVGTVTIKNNGTTAIQGWKVSWTYSGNQKISNSWNGTVTQSGASVTATNVNWNGPIAPGQSTSFGFQGTYSGSNATPTVTVTSN